MLPPAFPAALQKFEIDHCIYTLWHPGGDGCKPGPCASQTTTVALHHEGQQQSAERQVNKHLLGPAGCLSSAITGKNILRLMLPSSNQVEIRMEGKLK